MKPIKSAGLAMKSGPDSRGRQRLRLESVEARRESSLRSLGESAAFGQAVELDHIFHWLLEARFIFRRHSHPIAYECKRYSCTCS